MTSNQLHNWIAHPSLMDEKAILKLSQALEKHPYLGILDGLKARAYKNEGHLQYEEQLTKAALKMSERGFLYQIIHKEDDQNEEINTNFTSIEVVVSEDSSEKQEINDETKTKEEVVTQEEIVEVFSETTEEPDPIEELITSDILNATIEANIKAETTDIDPVETTEEIEITNETSSNEPPKTFGDWIKSLSTETKPEKEEIKLKSATDLIDTFLSKNISKIKVDKETLDQTSEKDDSQNEKYNFATETLASVYASQGQYSKAIEIYEQLNLKFPEKKSFFASRIRFLREKMEYDN